MTRVLWQQPVPESIECFDALDLSIGSCLAVLARQWAGSGPITLSEWVVPPGV